ncbi:MAG: His/Gly/Thr/Pro-type tRNA ligase C-terminal domain-containing protein, partial [Pseudomonadales bacterium]
EVLLDDRDSVRPGAKFNDAELIGIPHRIVIGERALAEGQVEYTSRATGETELWAQSEAISKIQARLA